VTRVDYGYCLVMEKDGREVRLHADKTTLMLGQLKAGDRVWRQKSPNRITRCGFVHFPEQISIYWETPRK